MWRMFKAGIVGVLLGIAGGVLCGYISYVKNYRDAADRQIKAHGVMYNNGQSDDNSIIRIKVDYDGEETTDDEDQRIANRVGNTILDGVESWLGKGYSDRYSYVEMRRNLNMVMDRIDDIACMTAGELGVDVDSDSRLSYEFFNEDIDEQGEACPAGFYHTLNIKMKDR